MKSVYLDHNATTPLAPEVLTALTEALGDYGNPSSMHSFGRETSGQVAEARQEIASLIGVEPIEIIFTSGGTEANHGVLNSFMPGIPDRPGVIPPPAGRNKIIVSAIEHPAVLEEALVLGARYGVEIKLVGVDRGGRVDLAALENLIDDETGLVSIMLANNELGTIQELAEVSRLAHAKGAFVHTDAVQAVGKIPVDVKTLGVDYLSASGHKINGPKGVGWLWVKRGVPFAPWVHGGHQENGRRAGTTNAPAIIALGVAARLARENLAGEAIRLAGLRNRLREGIIKSTPDVLVNGDPEHSLPNTLNLSFRAAEGESILLYLDLEGIAVSTGSACASGSLEPSHVLLACGLSAELAHGSIRFSLGSTTTPEEIEFVLERLPSVIKRIRAMSTIYQGAR